MIKIGRKHKVKYRGIKKEVMADLSMIICALRKNMSEEDIKYCVKTGFEAHNIFEKKPKFEKYVINAKDKSEALKQLEKLELPKELEEVIKKILK